MYWGIGPVPESEHPEDFLCARWLCCSSSLSLLVAWQRLRFHPCSPRGATATARPRLEQVEGATSAPWFLAPPTLTSGWFRTPDLRTRLDTARSSRTRPRVRCCYWQRPDFSRSVRCLIDNPTFLVEQCLVPALENSLRVGRLDLPL